jgi:hypothetical protein
MFPQGIYYYKDDSDCSSEGNLSKPLNFQNYYVGVPDEYEEDTQKFLKNKSSTL